MKNTNPKRNLGKRSLAFILALAAAITMMLSNSVNIFAASPAIWYCAHVEDIGWMSSVKNGAIAGTTGRSLQMEAVQIDLTGVSGGVTYRAHCQDIGWTNWATDCQTAGTTGKCIRMEAIQIKLTGEAANLYNIKYRAHCQDIGWTNWASNGETAGTTGECIRMEALEIVLEAKNVNGYTDRINAFINDGRWCQNAYYPATKRPIIASYGAYGCCAYAADFVKYVYGYNGFSRGTVFTNPNEIRSGDVIKVLGSQHWFVVLGRDGSRLTTAEGNWTNGRVCISSSAYTVQNNVLYRNGSPFRTFSAGYHFQ